MRGNVRSQLARFIPIRPWVALINLVIGIAITVPAFYLHDLNLALLGAVFLGGALGVLILPLPHPR